MRKLCLVFKYSVMVLLIGTSIGLSSVQAQSPNSESLYLVFEFMQVDNEQETAYRETELFWKEIHKQRIADGEIIGWDLWSLQPGGEDQGYQYLTVTLFDDPIKMMGGSDMMATARKAYPDMTEEQLYAKFEETADSRDLAVRLYLNEIATTESDFEMDIGTVASIELMKVTNEYTNDYEQAERDIFLPWHQETVSAGMKGSWGLLRVLSPIGSDVTNSHITVNMFTGWDQMFSDNSYEEFSFADQMMAQSGFQTRDMKWVYLATLRDLARTNQ